MDNQKIAILSYEHDGSRERYHLDTLGEDFEIDVAPENILMGICAHHIARDLIDEGLETSILTVGGSTRSNKRVVEKINDITGV